MICGILFSDTTILRIALDVPTREAFDYLPNPQCASIEPAIGMRFLVPFGRRKLVGVLLETADHSSLPANKLKKVDTLLDKEPVLSAATLDVLKRASLYYHYPVGEVVMNALPTLLRTPHAIEAKKKILWHLTDAGRGVAEVVLMRAPRQRELLTLLASHPEGLVLAGGWRDTVKRLQAKGWVDFRYQMVPRLDTDTAVPCTKQSVPISLNKDQRCATQGIVAAFGGFDVFLLDGITGSGKTEVYLDAIEAVVGRQQQALVLVPEINLTPQLTQRFQARFDEPIAVLHSQLTDKQRLDAWLAARDGEVNIVIGTRSAVSAQFPNLGLIIVDEEHDSSFKQQEGFRYSARDLAVMRGQTLNIPVVLGSATPSFETLYNVQQKRYRHLQLRSRYGASKLPAFKVVDLRSQPMTEGLSLELREQMKQHLAHGNQVLLFINRRGFAPTLLCHDCGWIARCQRCDSHMTLHQASNKLRCHHCGAERRAEPVCPSCQSSALIPVGEGTERVEKVLQQQFPGTGIVRIDRDTTRRKGSLESLLKDVHGGEARILVGTQMLAKGHHFPNVTLVGILNIDQGLFSVDFRALEKTAQLIVQVAGRAGREEKPGTVMLQTHYPDHPLLQTLLTAGYPEFARQAMTEREQANLPPYTFMALLRAESVNAEQPMAFLKEAKDIALGYGVEGVELWGPLPSPMEKRAGRYRAQLFIQSAERAVLHRLLTPWIDTLEQSRLGRKVRWSIDVDPVDVY